VTGKEDILTRPQIDAALTDLPDWRYRLGGLVTVYKTPTAAGALELIAAVGRLAEEKNPPPGPGLAATTVCSSASPRTTRAAR
jgi:4a-hydroxytetrahydrobiopterin dehydratase